MSKQNPQSLREVAQAALDNHPGASGRELDRLAKKQGLQITYTTINHLAAGTYKSRPSRATLDALAALSGYRQDEVYSAAGQPLPLKPLRDDLPEDADLLTGPQRRVVLATIRLLAQQNRALAELQAGVEEVPDNVRELPTEAPSRGRSRGESAARKVGKPPKGDPKFTE